MRKKSLKWLYVAGGMLLLVAGGLWLRQQCMDPERVFWATIKQSLTTRSVSIEAQQTNDATEVKQTVQYTLGAPNLSRSYTTLKQAGTDVRTEMLATPKEDYTRYTAIKTDQKRADGSAMDFSSVLGQWAKSEPGTNQFFEQAVLGTGLPLGGMGIPVGYLAPSARQELIRQLHKDVVYQANFKDVKKERRQGRAVYVYEVTLQPVAYVAFLKRFASSVGLHGLDQLDPNAYKGQQPVKLEVTIDVRAHHVVHVSIPGQDMSQSYAAYDAPVSAEVPAQVVPGRQLQERLQKLQ